MTDQEQFETIKDSMNTKGAELLLKQIKEHRESSDTILVPTEEMLQRYGYVQALAWIEGLMKQYKDLTWEDISGSYED
jgi:hypothetical protein